MFFMTFFKCIELHTWRPNAAHSRFQSGPADSLGSMTMVPARRPVPRLDGQVATQPRCSSRMKFDPLALNPLATSSQARTKRAMTSLIWGAIQYT